YFLALLNSKLLEWYLDIATGKLGKKMKIGQKSNFLNIPIFENTFSNSEKIMQIEELVNLILLKKKQGKNADTIELEREIDRLVYALYDLTEEEIAIIEKEFKTA
ncbi:MAG: hypothetical protein QXL18_05285, partial [Candidatus Woesearchaeota archaeon]